MPKNVKKPKRAKLHFLPSHPPGEIDDTLENLRLEMIDSRKKKNSLTNINYMMARTYSCRRQEVVAQSPDVADFIEKWPALFEAFQVITTDQKKCLHFICGAKIFKRQVFCLTGKCGVPKVYCSSTCINIYVLT